MYTNNAPCSLENDFYNVNFANVKIRNGIVCQALGNRNFQRGSLFLFGNSNSIESKLWN